MHTIFQYYASVKLKPLIIHHVVSVLFGLGLNKSARYRLIIVITTHMINDCGSILVKDNESIVVIVLNMSPNVLP